MGIEVIVLSERGASQVAAHTQIETANNVKSEQSLSHLAKQVVQIAISERSAV